MKNIFQFDPNLSQPVLPTGNLCWRSAKEPCFALFGSDALHEDGYHRLTKAERDIIRPINDGQAWCAEHSAGIQVRFETNSAHISVRVKLQGKFNMTNMTQIGQCGMDLYVYDERVGGFALHEVARYDFDASYYEVPLSHFVDAERVKRKYLMHLPLYIGVEELEIGLDEDAEVRPFGFKYPTRIGIYGTSITHGCSGSRPGLAYPNILSRLLDEEVLDFGFSGSAFMEREMGEIIGAHKLDLLVVDTEPNAGVDERLRDNTPAFLDAFFARNPSVPVILFSRVRFALDLYDDYRARMAEYYRGFLKETAKEYRRKGYKVYFADGWNIFDGNFTEFTADGIHPNDVGMWAIARAYEKKIKAVRKL